MQKTAISTPNAPAAIGPYSQAIQWGDLIFTSGQIPLSPVDQTMVSSTIEEETTRVIENLKALLEAAGSDLSKVLKSTVFLTDLGDFAAMNSVYNRYFTGVHPARSTIQVAGLPKGARVEIEVIATR